MSLLRARLNQVGARYRMAHVVGLCGTILQQAHLRRRESDLRSGIRQQWRVPLRCGNAESVRFLPRVEYFQIASQCGTHFLLSCRPTTTKGGSQTGGGFKCISPHGWCSCFCYSGKLRFWRWEVSYFGWRGNSAMILRDGRACGCAVFASGAGRNSRKQ